MKKLHWFVAPSLFFVVGGAACGDDDSREGSGDSSLLDAGVRAASPTDGGTTWPVTDGSAAAAWNDAGTDPASLDCATARDDCAEAHGFYKGAPFTCRASRAGGLWGYRREEAGLTTFFMLLTHCDAGIDRIAVQIPIMKTGPFDYDFSPVSSEVPYAIVEQVDATGRRETVDSMVSDFSGHASGDFTSERTLRGTYGARWLASGTRCKAKTADVACTGTSFDVTFNLSGIP